MCQPGTELHGDSESFRCAAGAQRPLHAEPIALHLRYLQTLAEIATENNSTTIFPVPIDFIQALVAPRGRSTA